MSRKPTKKPTVLVSFEVPVADVKFFDDKIKGSDTNRSQTIRRVLREAGYLPAEKKA